MPREAEEAGQHSGTQHSAEQNRTPPDTVRHHPPSEVSHQGSEIVCESKQSRPISQRRGGDVCNITVRSYLRHVCARKIYHDLKYLAVRNG